MKIGEKLWDELRAIDHTNHNRPCRDKLTICKDAFLEAIETACKEEYKKLLHESRYAKRLENE